MPIILKFLFHKHLHFLAENYLWRKLRFFYHNFHFASQFRFFDNNFRCLSQTVNLGRTVHNGLQFSTLIQGTVGALGPIITRERALYLEFTCELERVLNLTVSSEINAMLSHYEVDIEEQEGVFDIQMALFIDATFKTVAPPDYSVQVPEVLYIGAEVATTNPHVVLLLRIQICFLLRLSNFDF